MGGYRIGVARHPDGAPCEVRLDTLGAPPRFLPPPPSALPLPLLAGRASFVPPDPAVGTLEDLLAVLTRTRLAERAALGGFHVVSFRNNLNKLLHSPWEDAGWAIAVCRLRDTLFLGVTEPALQPDGAPAASDAVYMGYKFEEICTRGADAAAAVDPKDGEYCGVFEVRLGPFRCLLGAELDCHAQKTDHEKREGKIREVEKREGEIEGGVSGFVELKTCPEVRSEGQRRAYCGWRLRKQWIQSALVGVEWIFTGFKRGEQLVATQLMRTRDIPLQACGWAPQQALSCGVFLLSFLQQHARQGRHYLFRLVPRQGAKPPHVVLLELSSSSSSSPIASFLPPEIFELFSSIV